MLWRPEFNGDVLLSLDRLSVQEGGLVTPQANGAHCGRKKRGRAAYLLYIQHLAELSDGGADGETCSRRFGSLGGSCLDRTKKGPHESLLVKLSERRHLLLVALAGA